MLHATFAATAHFGLANAQQNNKTLMQPQGAQGMATNATNMNIVLVHGAWADGSSWSKVIPILENAGHKVIAVQLPLQDQVVKILDKQLANDYVLFTEALHSRLGSCSTSLLGGGHYD